MAEDQVLDAALVRKVQRALERSRSHRPRSSPPVVWPRVSEFASCQSANNAQTNAISKLAAAVNLAQR